MTALRVGAGALAFAFGLAAIGCKSAPKAEPAGPSPESQQLAQARAIIDTLEGQKKDLERQIDELRRKLQEHQNDREENVRMLEELRKKLQESQGHSSELQAQLEQFARSTPGTQMTADKAVRFEESLLFDPGKAELKADGQNALAKLAKILQGKNVYLKIDGHTDADPIHASKVLWRTGSNFELGAYRALAVLLYLETSCAIPADRMYLASYGQNRPVVANDTKDNKRKNRRVEISVFEK